jgi:serine phosphatase RsbU (regulator of sigma subunit)/ligand-binding sensor domain-containing protein
MRKLFFLFIVSFFIKISISQVIVDPVFQHLNPEQLGLKGMGWFDWDKNGLLWGIYKDGIYNYNGYSVKKWDATKKDGSLFLSPSIRLGFIDSKNNLWLAYSDNYDVTRFNTVTGKVQHYKADSLDKNKIPYYPITTIKEDRAGNIWLLTWGGGIVKLNAETGKCNNYIAYHDNGEFANRARDMVELPDGRLLIAYFGSEWLHYIPTFFNPKTETFEKFPVRDYIDAYNDTLNKITFGLNISNFVYVDKQGSFWFGTYSGLIYFNVKTHKVSRVTGFKNNLVQNLDNARCYVVDENERIWVGTPNSGVMVANPQTSEAQYLKHDVKVTTSIADNKVRIIKKDPDGNIWVSTGLGPVSIYNPLVQQFDMAPWSDMNLAFADRSQQVIPVNQVLVKRNGLMYVTSESGVSVYDINKKNLAKKVEPDPDFVPKTFSPSGKKSISDIKRIDDNHFFAINNSAIATVLNDKTNSFSKIEGSTQDSILKKGHLHILFRHVKDTFPLYTIGGYNGSIYQYDLKKNRLSLFFRFNVSKDYKQNFSYVLKSGKWLLYWNEREFCIFDPAKKQYKLYGPDHKDTYFPDSTLKTAYMDKEGLVWLGTENGLYTFDETTGKSTNVTSRLGLKNTVINSMIADQKGIWWIALDKKLIKWNIKNNQTFAFGAELGLKVGSFIPAVAQTDDAGRIYMASMNGVLIFDPEKIKVPATIPKIGLSFLSIKDDTLSTERLQMVSSGKSVFKWNENFLNFEFGSNQIYTPLPHHFYYRLLGLDSVWQDNDISNKIKYTNLAAGSYTLEVKLENAYNTTSDVFQLPFQIKPPFWLTWWFYVLLICLIIISGYCIIKYRERAFIKKQEILENRIQERTAEVVAKADEIRLQKDMIQEKNKELTDSIFYAQRIQQSILPDELQIRKGLDHYFILFKPKDIVSGDFYWYSKQNDSVLWAVVDCTGHGVPGGFMSMLGSGLLNQIVNEELRLQPDEILNHLRDRVITALKQTGAYGESKDGMDITLCHYTPSSRHLQFAGAHNSLYIIRNGEMIELNGNKQPIGIHIGDKKNFTLHERELKSGDSIFMSSDGYADQFGGPKGKKFKSSNFEKLLVKISTQDTVSQKTELETAFNSWKEGYEQLDDVCVFGIKIS